MKYPTLFLIADRAALNMQRRYFVSLYAQFFLLTCASTLTLFSVYFDPDLSLAIYFCILLLGLMFALILASQRPNQEWYNMRALAESAKTLTWRYAMRAQPFEENQDEADMRNSFAERLHSLLTVHGASTNQLVQSAEFGEIVTSDMGDIRSMPVEEQSKIYLNRRICDQLKWYQDKSHANSRMAVRFSTFVVLIYIAAIIMVVVQFSNFALLSPPIVWMSEPLLVLAASVLGVAQAKRYSELAASYALTGREIQKLDLEFNSMTDFSELPGFVARAEAAFSREHTQWIIRMDPGSSL